MSEIEEFGLNPEQMLTQVNKAIYNICAGGQSYTIGSRSLTRANLTELYEMQKNLQAQAIRNQENSSLMGDTCVAVFDGR